MTYHYTPDNDIPAFNVVGSLLFPQTAMYYYYYTREGAPPCLVVTSAVMHVTLTKAPRPHPNSIFQTVLSLNLCVLSSASSVNADIIL